MINEHIIKIVIVQLQEKSDYLTTTDQTTRIATVEGEARMDVVGHGQLKGSWPKKGG